MFWWVELDLFSLECNEVSSSEFLSVHGFGVTLDSLYFNAQGYVPTLLILQQCKNTAMNIKMQAAQSHTKTTDTPKLTTGHIIALQREEIQLHPPEHRCKLP